MVDSQKNKAPRLWISYPWVSKEERDFTYLVKQLKDANIEAVYDSLQLQADMAFGERTVQRLLSIGFDGWLYILTHQCFTRKVFTNELTAAIDKAVQKMGPKFPMIGLLYGIASQQVPPMLRVRPCISLGDPNWKRQITEAIGNSDKSKPRFPQNETRFVWKIHQCYGGDPALTAIEVHSKEESVQYWRFAIPKSARPIRWGQGVSGGGEISHIRFAEATGSGRYENHDISWFGAANIISNTESAYVVFPGSLPNFICFGPAKSPFGPPNRMEIFWTALSGKAVQTTEYGSNGTAKSIW